MNGMWQVYFRRAPGPTQSSDFHTRELELAQARALKSDSPGPIFRSISTMSRIGLVAFLSAISPSRIQAQPNDNDRGVEIGAYYAAIDALRAMHDSECGYLSKVSPTAVAEALDNALSYLTKSEESGLGPIIPKVEEKNDRFVSDFLAAEKTGGADLSTSCEALAATIGATAANAEKRWEEFRPSLVPFR